MKNYTIITKDEHARRHGRYTEQIDLNSVKKDSDVKISVEFEPEFKEFKNGFNNVNIETFWVKVTEVDNEVVKGTINNDLICKNHGLKYDDLISFTFDKILSIY